LADSETSTFSAAAKEGGIIHTAVDASEPASSVRREISFILMKDSFHMASDPDSFQRSHTQITGTYMRQGIGDGLGTDGAHLGQQKSSPTVLSRCLYKLIGCRY
jgi:hypothetical protein